MNKHENIFPSGFSGLVYPPDSENGVAFLMGLLWKCISDKYKFAIEKFEADPKIESLNHGKWFDVKGKQYINGEWINITLEFKVKSSGFIRDIKEHSNIFVNFLVCWEHDITDERLRDYVGEVIELRSIYNRLSEEKRKNIILFPKIPFPKKSKRGPAMRDISKILNNFSKENQPKVNYLISEWPDHEPGEREIIFKRRGVSIFRAGPYTLNKLNITKSVPQEIRKKVETEIGKFNEEKKEEAIYYLDRLTIDDIRKFLNVMG